MALTVADPKDLEQLSTHGNREVRRAAVVALRRQQSPAVKVFLSDREPLVVLEAARAINDTPINQAMPALAELIDATQDEDAIARRVLNANFRLGHGKTVRR